MAGPEIKIGANVGNATKALDELSDALGEVVDAAKGASDAAEGVSDLVDALTDVVDAVRGISGASDGVSDLAEALNELAEAGSDAAEVVDKLSDAEVMPDAEGQAKDVRSISDAIGKLGREVASANRSKLRTIDPRASADDLRTIERQFDQLKRMSRSTRDALRFSGQSGAGFHEIDWAKMHMDPKRAAEMRNRAYQYVTRGTQYQVESGQGAAGPSFLGQAASRVLSSAGGGAGQVGGIFAGAANAGMAGGGLAGAARFGAIGLLGFGAFKAASAVNEGYENAKSASLDVDRIKRGMGDLGVNFNTLREAAYESAKGLGLNANESTKLALEMNRTMGGFKSATDLLTETRNAAGFSRSFGMGDPSQAGAFFASMRLYGASKTDQDNRKLALQIGEVISRSGMSAKADEVLAAIQGYVAETSRNSLSSPNANAYGTAFGGLMGLGLNGMTGDVAANILSSANRSMMGMGAAGEAGQNFTLSAYEMSGGRLNPIQAALLAEGGLFGTRGGAFGGDSAYAKYMRTQGRDVSRMGLNTGDGTTNFQSIRDHLDRMGADPDLKLDMAKRYFGLSSYNQTAALMTLDPKATGQMEGLLKRNKIDLNSVNETGILTMGKIAGAGSIDDLRGISAALRGRTGAGSLSAAERDQLSGLEKSGSFEQLQDALTKIAASKEQQETEASKMLKQTKDVETAVTELGTHLIGPVNTMRDALLSMTNMGPKALRQRVVDLEKSETDAAYKSTVHSIEAEADDKIDGDGKGLRSKLSAAKSRLMAAQRGPLGSMSAQERNAAIAKAEQDVAEIEKQIAETERERARKLKEAAEKRDKEKSDIDKRFRDRDEAERKAVEAINGGGPTPSAVPQASYSNEGRAAYQSAGVTPPSSAPSGSGGQSAAAAPTTGMAGGSVTSSNARRLANFKTTPEQDKAILEAAGGDQNKARIMRGLLSIENRGFGRPRDDATSPAGAVGAWQFMPGTWKDHGEGGINNARDFGKGAKATSKFIDWIKKKYKTNDPAVIAAYYNGGDPAARAVLAGRAAPAAETREYVGMMGAAMGSGARVVPDGDPVKQVESRQQSTAQRQQMVYLNGEIRLLDANGKPVPAEVNVNPRVGPPRGTGAAHVATR